MSTQRVVVGISGGVDSSVAALLLREQGYEVHGVFMKNWEESFAPGYCSAADDLRDAQDVCTSLDIPLHCVNFSAEYRDRVFSYFLAEYQRGRTPNPDILCNREIKFKAFLDYALSLGADWIATGHYARVERTSGKVQLLKGLDPGKDQSYFLSALNHQQLERALFPVGHLPKRQVRQLAEQAGLVTFDKKDSTGICFIGERDFREFLQHFLPAQPGVMQTPEGLVVGEHQGLMYYTIGQRQGLGIGGRAGASSEPWFVVDKDLPNNRLIVAQGEHPLLYHRGLYASSANWIAGITPEFPLRCSAKTRYRQPDQACWVHAHPETGGLRIEFDQAQRAITPGQAVVFYHQQLCLGGASIDCAFD